MLRVLRDKHMNCGYVLTVMLWCVKKTLHSCHSREGSGLSLLQRCCRVADRQYMHAGIVPAIPINQQHATDALGV